MLLARRKSDDTADVVVKLSKLLRFMLYESKSRLVKINDEIKMLDDYIELEKIRYNGRLTISFLREVDNENEQFGSLATDHLRGKCIQARSQRKSF